MTPTSKPSGDETPEETSRPEPDYGDLDEDQEAGRTTQEYEQEGGRIYDWQYDGTIDAPDAPGLLNGTIDAAWTGESWQLSIDGVSDDALRMLLGSAVAEALIERREKAA